MLRDLTRKDWLGILGIHPDQVPRALILRGTRNLRRNYDCYRECFDDVVEVGSPNGLLEDVLIGEFAGAKVAYASVYGAAMASEVTHLFGVLGTRLVLQTGCCGAWKAGIEAGDLFIPTDAGCGEGASQYYVGRKQVVAATLDFNEYTTKLSRESNIAVHFGRIFTTAALFAEGVRELEQWASEGWDGVDMETAATFAVAEHFGMDSAGVLFVFDNPRDHGDIILTESEKDERRRLGNSTMIETTFEIVRQYLNQISQR
jgi:purine-nucleoside phosphorylase